MWAKACLNCRIVCWNWRIADLRWRVTHWNRRIASVLLVQARIQGRWNGWIFTPFFWAFFFLFIFFSSLKYWLVLFILYYKNSPPFQNPYPRLLRNWLFWIASGLEMWNAQLLRRLGVWLAEKYFWNERFLIYELEIGIEGYHILIEELQFLITGLNIWIE